jgi:hypothetical protein
MKKGQYYSVKKYGMTNKKFNCLEIRSVGCFWNVVVFPLDLFQIYF